MIATFTNTWKMCVMELTKSCISSSADSTHRADGSSDARIRSALLLRAAMLRAIAVICLIGCTDRPTEFSYTSAIVYGTVRNSSGARVPNAQVMIDVFFE